MSPQLRTSALLSAKATFFLRVSTHALRAASFLRDAAPQLLRQLGRKQ